MFRSHNRRQGQNPEKRHGPTLPPSEVVCTNFMPLSDNCLFTLHGVFLFSKKMVPLKQTTLTRKASGINKLFTKTGIGGTNDENAWGLDRIVLVNHYQSTICQKKVRTKKKTRQMPTHVLSIGKCNPIRCDSSKHNSVPWAPADGLWMISFLSADLPRSNKALVTRLYGWYYWYPHPEKPPGKTFKHSHVQTYTVYLYMYVHVYAVTCSCLLQSPKFHDSSWYNTIFQHSACVPCLSGQVTWPKCSCLGKNRVPGGKNWGSEKSHIIFDRSPSPWDAPIWNPTH